MSSLPGDDLANRALQHIKNGERHRAIECYTRAASIIEAAVNSGETRPGYDLAQLARDYRAKAGELARESRASDSGSSNYSTMLSMTSASSVFGKFKSSASKAASATKETAISVGQKSAAYTTTAMNTMGSMAKNAANSAACGLGQSFGGTLGSTLGKKLGERASRALPSQPHKR